jgi:hypothetical protein
MEGKFRQRGGYHCVPHDMPKTPPSKVYPGLGRAQERTDQVHPGQG